VGRRRSSDERESCGESDALRIRLQKLNPTSDAGYGELFDELVSIDGELRRIRQRGDEVA